MKQKTFKQLQPGIESLKCWISCCLADRHSHLNSQFSWKNTSIQLFFSLFFMVLCSVELIGQEPVVSFDTIRFERNFTGIGTDAAKEVNWHMAGSISADDQKINWDVDIYCPGSITKSKERIRNDDGSFSTENSRENEINWDKSLGFIKNQSVLYLYKGKEQRGIFQPEQKKCLSGRKK